MALSKERKVAETLNQLSACNLHTAASASQWSELVSSYFCDNASEGSDFSDDSEDEDGLHVVDAEIDLDPENDDDKTENLGLQDDSNIVDEIHDDIDVEHKSTPAVNDDQPQDPLVVDEVAAAVNEMQDLLPTCSTDKDKEYEVIRKFNCNCKLNNGKPCYDVLSADSVYELRMCMSALPDFEKDLILLGKISCFFSNGDLTHSSKKKEQKKREHQRTNYFVHEHRICRDIFKFIHCISQNKLTALLKHYKENGLTPRYKKSGGRRATDPRLLTHEDVNRVVTFIVNFAEAHALSLPGRVPGYKRFDIKLLPSHFTKTSICKLYTSAMETAGHRAVKTRSFRSLWGTLLPYIVLTRPMTDLCWVCQRNNSAVYRSANMSDEEKTSRIKAQELHITKVTLERSLYQDMVRASKELIRDTALVLGENSHNSRDITMHYSFDYAQQVHYPSDPMQPGPMYFLTPRKCGLFGVTCEGLPQQLNYLIDEGMCISKGSNAVISFLDHFFISYGLGEMHLQLHCDNCSGQNKNNMMLWYLLWRVLSGHHKTISLNFLITGHTKFAPDWCFGLVKQRYRKTMVSCLDDIVDVVTSSTERVNIAQKVGSEDGKVFVPQRDWQNYLKPFFKTLPGIKKNQHFRFDAEHPGCVFYKQFSDSEEQMVCLMKNAPPLVRPKQLSTPGLDEKRQKYLFKYIREFCTPATMDITCPMPVNQTVED